MLRILTWLLSRSFTWLALSAFIALGLMTSDGLREQWHEVRSLGARLEAAQELHLQAQSGLAATQVAQTGATVVQSIAVEAALAAERQLAEERRRSRNSQEIERIDGLVAEGLNELRGELESGLAEVEERLEREIPNALITRVVDGAHMRCRTRRAEEQSQRGLGVLNRLESGPSRWISCQVEGFLSPYIRHSTGVDAEPVEVEDPGVLERASQEFPQAPSVEAVAELERIARDNASEAAAELAARTHTHAAAQAISDELRVRAERLEEEKSRTVQLIAAFKRNALKALFIALIILLSPYLARMIAWPLLKLLEKGPAFYVRLRDDLEGTTTILAEEPGSIVEATLGPGEALSCRSTDIRHFDRDNAKGRVLYKKKAPLVSIAARLLLLTEVRAGPNEKQRVTIGGSDGEAVDQQVVELKLTNHPGLVIHPSYIVALTGDFEVRSQWTLSRHAVCSGQLRFIKLSGTGRVFLEGFGAVEVSTAKSNSPQLRHHSLIAFDGRLGYRIRRTEVFLPYLFGLAPPVEIGLRNETGADADDAVFVWQKCSHPQNRDPASTVIGAIWSALGKILGL